MCKPHIQSLNTARTCLIEVIFFVFKPISSSKNRYESVVIGNGLANQVSNPDVDVDITKPDIVIRSQIAVLKEMTSWLKAAHSGNDISFESGKGFNQHFKNSFVISYTIIIITA